MKTEISEIFSSVQGEGFYLGAKQIFVRFGRCNMHCTYCDELPKMQSGAYSITSIEEIVNQIQELEKTKGPHHSVSFTGGEPLMYADALQMLLKKTRQIGIKNYVETNATFPRVLKTILDDIDIISIDLKPETSSEDRDFWIQHHEFLKIASDKEGYVKVVVTAGTTDEDLRKCRDLVHTSSPNLRLVFQPVSNADGPDQNIWNQLEQKRMNESSVESPNPYWVIPQMHKIWKIR